MSVPDHPTNKRVEEYFGTSPDRRLVDTAALIVALVDGRDSATRTDYAHPRLIDIVELLQALPQSGSPH